MEAFLGICWHKQQCQAALLNSDLLQAWEDLDKAVYYVYAEGSDLPK